MSQQWGLFNAKNNNQKSEISFYGNISKYRNIYLYESSYLILFESKRLALVTQVFLFPGINVLVPQLQAIKQPIIF